MAGARLYLMVCHWALRLLSWLCALNQHMAGQCGSCKRCMQAACSHQHLYMVCAVYCIALHCTIKFCELARLLHFT
jgi:hypothetical protein